jgi:malate dehydrogenase
MRVWGVAAVEAAGDELRIGPDDLITPLARERTAELGIRIVDGGSGGRVPRGLQPAVPPSPVIQKPLLLNDSDSPSPQTDRSAISLPGALYRRGAPVGATGGRPSPGGPATRRVMVVGAGHVGMITAARLADANVFNEIILVDVVDGLAAGVALDLTHTAGLTGSRTQITGTTMVEDAGPADYVVITAGRARQPGMSRSDLAATNAAIIGDVATRVAAVAPEAVLVVVTNPLDEMTQHAWRISGFPASRVIGMAGVLDTARFRALAALAVGLAPDQLSAVALGSHGDEMVIPLSQARADGRLLTEVLGKTAVAAIVDRTRDSGAEVVGLLKQGSAFMAPGASAARMVLAMAADRGDVLPAAVLADGSYGISDVYIGLPVRVGPNGVKEILELPLTEAELADLRKAADRIRRRLDALAGAS